MLTAKHQDGRLMLGTLAVLALAACGQTRSAAPDSGTSETQQPATTVIVWPTGFVVMGDGYPKSGDPCRRLGESALTINYLDDSAILVGCAGADGDEAAKAVMKATGGQVLGSVNGVTLITIPQGDANVGMAPASASSRENKGSDKQ
jgi:ABC-type Na+ efflux pump permease subunit